MDKKIVEYKFIYVQGDKLNFERNVNLAIEEGRQPQGGTTVYVEDEVYYYMQAIVKYDLCILC